MLTLAILAGLFKFGMNYTFPWLIGEALDRVVQPPAPVEAEQRFRWLWILVGAGVFFSALHSLSTWSRSYFTAWLGNRVIADLRQDLFDHLNRLSLHFYSKERTGSIVSRIISDIQTASQLVNGGVITVVMDVFSMSIGIVLLWQISPKLTLASLSILPMYAITFKLLNPRVKRASLRVQSQLSKISGNVTERLAGIAVVKTYAAEGREREQFVADTEEHYDRVLEQTSLSALVGALSEGIVHIGQVIVIGFGGYLALTHTPPLTAGEITRFVGTLAVMYLPVRRFADINVVYQTSIAAIERVFQVFDITPKIVERPDAVTIKPPRGEVVFENVIFDYTSDQSDETRVSLEDGPAEPKPADELKLLEKHRQQKSPPRRPVLDDLSLRVAPGERVALVGPSGSGKTTLVSLLPRLYDVSSGRITIDGVDLRDYRLKTLRKSIGIVQQDSFMFSGTVRENIAYGRPKATDAEVIAAAEAANADEFIRHLPDAYESRLGERGVNLSGGQRQRLSIARALLKDPKILILDEATSALDSHSEALVQAALLRLMRERTCFIIAHRLSTVRNVDRILVLEAGRVVESGTHDELLRSQGLYAKLVRHQYHWADDAPQHERPVTSTAS